jgi:myo-inositol 2-dehydrogenase/D-chiro-inositol 1-dehydrogenase
VPAAARRWPRDTGAEVRSAEAILAADDIDAVVIGTPTDTHYDLIHGAAKNGQGDLLRKAHRHVGRQYPRLHRRRRGSGRALPDRVQPPLRSQFRGTAGPHRGGRYRRGGTCATITSRDPAPPPISYIERSGGLFRDMMIHDFDMARFLLGEEFVRLHAVGSALVDPAIGAAGDVDTAAVILTTASGRICQISNSRRAAYGYDQRIEVHGAKGCCAPRTSWRQRWNCHRARASARPPRSTSS